MAGWSEPGGGEGILEVAASAKAITGAHPAPVADANISKTILCDKTIISAVYLFVCGFTSFVIQINNLNPYLQVSNF
jgi:hypothetical protein